MTRVAVLEPYFRTSGVTTYVTHLAEGFRRAGCDVDVLTFTPSGRPPKGDTSHLRPDNKGVKSGWQWSAYAPDAVHPWSDAKAVLPQYDLVFLNEPRCAPLDKKAMRKRGKGEIVTGRQAVRDGDVTYDDLPEYVKALAEAGVPWATCLHDPGYNQKLAPWLPQLLEVAPPSVVVTHRPGALESAAWAYQAAGVPADAAHLDYPHLPFAFEPREAERRDRGWPQVIGTTGRYINNKGQPTVIGLAAYGLLQPGWSVEVGGASPLGAGPNHTFLTYESLTKHMGFRGEREGNGNVTTGDPWRVWSDDGELMASYYGPYADGVDYSLRHGVHVSATDVGFSGPGGLEYADLEALAAGCMLVMPEHRDVRQEYSAIRYDLQKCLNAELHPLDPAREASLRSMAEATDEWAGAWSDASYLQTQARDNWDVALDLNDPVAYANQVLDAALEGSVTGN